MLKIIVITLIILWFFGYLSVSGGIIPNVELFAINNHPITLWSVLILLVVSWAISVLPRPFQTITSVLLVLWALSVVGILATTGLANIIVLVIIVGLVVSMFL